MITVISMYRGYDAETFVQVVNGTLTDDEKDAWRKSHKCDVHHCDDEDICDDHNNMFFRTLVPSGPEPTDLLNVDGERHPGDTSA